MIKIIDQDAKDLGSLLYQKNIPRIDELLIQDGKYYRVFGVIYDDDEGDITVCVKFLGTTSEGMERLILAVDSGTSFESVKRLALSALIKCFAERQSR